MGSRLSIFVGIVVAAAAALVLWVLHAGFVNHWLAVHTGTVNEPGPYYGFWSGFGSDIAEFGIIGAIGTAAYQLIKKFNCHEPGCWRVGTHLAAGGQFALCYRHHPDYQGKRPTHDLIAKLHRENAEREAAVRDLIAKAHLENAEGQAAIQGRLAEIQQRLNTRAGTDAGVETSSGGDHRSPPVPEPQADGHT
jgi:hypothetical protein